MTSAAVHFTSMLASMCFGFVVFGESLACRWLRVHWLITRNGWLAPCCCSLRSHTRVQMLTSDPLCARELIECVVVSCREPAVG